MPEYLAPGAYVEEVGGRARPIEGVSTGVTGFVGPTRYGPVGGEPELLTSFADFRRLYGGIDRLAFQDSEVENYVAHAVRAFFDNGGSRLYVTRIFEPSSGADTGTAGCALDPPATLILRARFPGRAGNMEIVFAARTSLNLLSRDPTTNQVRVTGLQENDVVAIKPGPASPPAEEELYDVQTSGGDLLFVRPDGSQVTVDTLDPSPGAGRVHRLTLSVRVRQSGRSEEEQGWDELSPHPQAHNALLSLFTHDPATHRQYLTIPFAIEGDVTSGAALVEALLGQEALDKLSLYLSTDAEIQPASRPALSELGKAYKLENGNDGNLPGPEAYQGVAAQPAGTNPQPTTGLETFAGVEEISIVAAPGHSRRDGQTDDPARRSQIAGSLVAHCERMRYRMAVLDPPDGLAVAEVQDYRQQFDSAHAALYYPWVTIVDPLDPAGVQKINVPPSGHVAGVYARTDAQRGVFKAPVNEVVLGAIGLETLLNKAQQDVLNPMGINCVRFFENRGYRLWGTRTISSDPEWRYTNVRRYCAYLEHSIDRGTQWAVIESNGEPLWASARRTVEDFLLSEWRRGGLVGTKSEEAFFVRCDHSTMTQNDLDNGRLVCLIGVAVVRPAEFLIFRIGQWTADSPQ